AIAAGTAGAPGVGGAVHVAEARARSPGATAPPRGAADDRPAPSVRHRAMPAPISTSGQTTERSATVSAITSAARTNSPTATQNAGPRSPTLVTGAAPPSTSGVSSHR